MERLSGLDSAFLSLETPTVHLHVAMLAVLDTSTMPAPYSFEALKEFVTPRLMRLATTHRRTVDVPFGLNHPLWVEDPHLDLDYHIRRHVLPPPGGEAELAELVGSIVGVPLDRRRPLWELHIIEGLGGEHTATEGGRIAVVGKIHHCAVDGVSGAELFVHLFDLGPHPEPVEATPRPVPERIPSDLEMVGHAVWSRARRSLGFPALLGRTVQTVGRLVRRHRDPETVVGAVPLTAPRTPWNTAITPHRSVAFARVSLHDVKAVKNALGVKVNDVVLALVSTAARRYLAEHDALPAAPLVAMCPVSIRTEDERGNYDNRISPMFVRLRTDVTDADELLAAIATATRGAKEDFHAVGARFLQNWAEHAAPTTFALASRLYTRLSLADRHPPIYNLLVSNVPGPSFPLYMAGGRLIAAYPLGPVSEGAGLNVTVLSIEDHVDFGFVACREQVPDLDAMAGHVEDAMVELLAAAGIRTHETVPALEDAPAEGSAVAANGSAPAAPEGVPAAVAVPPAGEASAPAAEAVASPAGEAAEATKPRKPAKNAAKNAAKPAKKVAAAKRAPAKKAAKNAAEPVEPTAEVRSDKRNAAAKVTGAKRAAKAKRATASRGPRTPRS